MKHKHIVIVGGTSGSGRVLVRRFSEKHNIVSLIGRHSPPEVNLNLLGVYFYKVDLCDNILINEAIDQIVSDHGPISHLVFYQRFRGEGDDWFGEIQVSLTATKNIIEKLSVSFDNSIEKSIVVVGSLASHLIHDEQPVSYHMVKAGLNQMVRYYAVLLGSKGIRVNCVSPSTVIKEESKSFYAEQVNLRRLYEDITPLKRMGTSEDIADVVEFLCSIQSKYITGQEIMVDGGLSLVGQTSLARSLSKMDGLRVTRK